MQTWGPAGGGIWSAPTIDAARRAVYVATGNGYADPPQLTTDAVLALDIDTGKLRWSLQPLANDVWAGGCGRGGNPDNPNCPAALGPDHDFSASPMLGQAANGQDVLIVQQKSGMAYALRSRQAGRDGVAVPHEPRRRARRAVGRGGRRPAGVFRRQRSAQRRPAACAR